MPPSPRSCAAGGKVLMPAWDIPDVGRIAMVTDPQGIPFYVMRGASDGTSTAFGRTTMEPCELERTENARSGGGARLLQLDLRRFEIGIDADGGDGRLHLSPAWRRGHRCDDDQSPGGGPPGWGFYFPRARHRICRKPKSPSEAGRSLTGRWRFPAGRWWSWNARRPAELPSGSSRRASNLRDDCVLCNGY